MSRYRGRPPPCEFSPPLRPAAEAKSRFCAKGRLLAGTLCPPLLAMARCFAGSMEANPRFDVDVDRVAVIVFSCSVTV